MQRNYKSTSKESAFTPSGLSDSPLSAEVSLFSIMETKDLENPDYFVTSEGDVYSKYWHNSKVCKKLTPRVSKRGYLSVHFYINGKEVVRPIHRLVAMAFIPNPLNLPQVNHKDFNKKNNNVSNLEWCTNEENWNHAKSSGIVPALGTRQGVHKLTEAQVREIKEKFKDGQTYLQMSREYGVHYKTVYDIVYNRTWKHI